MGLDMYLYAVSKLEKEEAEKYNGRPIEELYDSDISAVLTKIDEDDTGSFDSIKPYLTKARMIDMIIDIDRIIAENQIPDDAYVSGRTDTQEYVELIFRNDNRYRKDVRISREKLLEEYVIYPETDVYLYRKREIHYWGKYFGLQDFIYDMLKNDDGIDVQNCGYYRLSDEQIEKINGYLKDHPRGNGRIDRIQERNTEDEAIIYWEWY